MAQEVYEAGQPLVNLVSGGPSSWADMTGINDPAHPAAQFRNLGGGGAGSWQAADGTSIGTAGDAGFNFDKPIGGLSATFAFAVNAQSFAATGAITGASLAVTGAISAASAAISGNETVGGTLGVTGAITGSSTVQGTRLISTVATGTAPLTVASTTMVSNFNAEYVGGQNLTNLDARYVDASGDTMSGALTLEPAAASDQILKIKGSITSGGFWLGGTNGPAPSLMFRDNANALMAQVNQTGATYALDVNPASSATNAARFTKDVLITQDLGVRAIVATGAISGTTGTFSGAISGTTGTFSGGISAGASSAITGGLTVVTVGLTVQAGGITNTGGVYNTQTANSTSGGLTNRRSGGVSEHYLYQGGDDHTYLQNSNGKFYVFEQGGHLIPGNDGAYDLGSASKRMRTLYATTGAINTSSRAVKQDISLLPPAEALRVALGTDIATFAYRSLPDYPMVGFIAEDVDALLSPDHASANPQTTASVALAAVRGLAELLADQGVIALPGRG